MFSPLAASETNKNATPLLVYVSCLWQACISCTNVLLKIVQNCSDSIFKLLCIILEMAWNRWLSIYLLVDLYATKLNLKNNCFCFPCLCKAGKSAGVSIPREDTTVLYQLLFCAAQIVSFFCVSRDSWYIRPEWLTFAFSCHPHYLWAAEQAGESESRYGRLHHNEPWLCWPI